MITSLQDIINRNLAVSTHELNDTPDRAAAFELQERLCDLGLLDPIIAGDANTVFKPVAKADGSIGVETRNAIFEFCKLAKVPYEDFMVTPAMAKALLGADAAKFLGIETKPKKVDSAQTLLVKQIVLYMQQKGYWIARSPNMYNIVYIEGLNSDGSENDDAPNVWNDRRMVFRIRANGKPEMIVNDQATTEPGNYYVINPLNPHGAARIAFGQYKAWVDGMHKGVQPALVQRGLIKVHRDLNKDGKRTKTDPIDIGDTFGINQHSTAEGVIPTNIDRYSAGCLVGRRYAWHLKFLSTLRRDVRYKLNKSYMFMTTVIAGDDLNK